MSLIPESGPEMKLLVGFIADTIEYYSSGCINNIKNGPNEYAQEKAKATYQRLREIIHNDADLQILKAVVKDACIGVIHSTLHKFDEGLEDDTPQRELQYYDIVDRETREFVITYSASDEFLYDLPDDFIPFPFEGDFFNLE